MTRENSMFLVVKPIEGETISFGGMGKGNITSIGKIGFPFLASINNVLYVEGLKYNLLIISQFSDNDYIMLQKRPVYSKDIRWEVLFFCQTTQQSI